MYCPAEVKGGEIIKGWKVYNVKHVVETGGQLPVTHVHRECHYYSYLYTEYVHMRG